MSLDDVHVGRQASTSTSASITSTAAVNAAIRHTTTAAHASTITNGTSARTSPASSTSSLSSSLLSPPISPPMTPSSMLVRSLADLKIQSNPMMHESDMDALRVDVDAKGGSHSHSYHHHQGVDADHDTNTIDGELDHHSDGDGMDGDDSPSPSHGGMAGITSSENSTHLFIGDLSRTATEDQLRSVFGSHGTVTHVDIKRDKFTTNNLGYGFVAYRTRDEANMAKKALNGVEIAGRKIRIGWAQKNTTLFIGDLDGTISTAQLQEVFRTFGALIEDETYVKSPSGKFGFVRYQQRADAERAKLEMNRKLLGSRAIRIGWGDNNVQKHCIHVQFNPTQGGHLTENHFRKHFERFGPVLSISLPRYPNRRLKGYGFVHFEDTAEGSSEKAANQAIEALAESKIGSVPIRCNFGKKQNYSRFQNRRNQFMMGGSPSGTSPIPSATSPGGMYSQWLMGMNASGQWQAAAAAAAAANGYQSPTSPISSSSSAAPSPSSGPTAVSSTSTSPLPSLPYYSPAARGRSLDAASLASMYQGAAAGYYPQYYNAAAATAAAGAYPYYGNTSPVQGSSNGATAASAAAAAAYMRGAVAAAAAARYAGAMAAANGSHQQYSHNPAAAAALYQRPQHMGVL